MTVGWSSEWPLRHLSILPHSGRGRGCGNPFPVKIHPDLLAELAVDYGVSLPSRGQHFRPPGDALCVPVGEGRKTACHSGEGIEHVPCKLLELLPGVKSA